MDGINKDEASEKEITDNVDEIEQDGDIQIDDEKDTEGEDGEESEKKAELEPWEITDEDKDANKPEKTLKQKKAWRREKAAVNNELEKLKAENEALRANSGPKSTGPVRPDRYDFDDDDEYDAKYAEYIVELTEAKRRAGKAAEAQRRFDSGIERGVEVHNERVSDFIAGNGISPDVYAARDAIVIAAIEKVTPGKGERVLDLFLSRLGEGSEKMPYFLGGNQAKLAELVTLLDAEPDGFSAMKFLTEENIKLRGKATGKPKSKAPAPASTAKGGIATPSAASTGRLKRQYDSAHAENDDDKAWDVRKQARSAGIDVSGW